MPSIPHIKDRFKIRTIIRRRERARKGIGLLVDGPNMLRKEFQIDLEEIRSTLKEFGDIKVGRVYLNQYASEKLVEAIENFMKENPKYGYRSIAQFMEDAARKRLEELNALGTMPRFEHFNRGPDGVKIFDRRLRRIADVYFKPDGIFCDLDQKDDCEHITFALTVPEIQEVIRQRRKEGWKLPEV